MGARKFTIVGGATLRIDPLAGDGLRVRSGEVWVTQSRDPEGYLLKTGDSLILDHKGAAHAIAYRLTLLDLIRNGAAGGQVRTERRPMRVSGWWARRLLGKIFA